MSVEPPAADELATVAAPTAINLVSIFCADHVALAAGPVALGFHHDDAYDLLGLADERRPTGTRVHCTFDAGDAAAIDRSAERLRAAGATVLKEPFTTYYGARQVVFADPEGNVMRLSTPQHELRAH